MGTRLVVTPQQLLNYETDFDFSCYHYVYSCGEGRIMTPDRKGCVDKNECLDSPCRNGGVCLNQDPRIRYRCICPDGFWGENCELVQEGQKLKLGMGALAAILVCLLIILSKLAVAIRRPRLYFQINAHHILPPFAFPDSFTSRFDDMFLSPTS